MTEFESQGGVAFLLIHFTMRNDFYYMPYIELKQYIDRVADGHAKNFKYTELEDEYFLKPNGGALVNYLVGLQRDLESRDE
jgi:recombination protein U